MGRNYFWEVRKRKVAGMMRAPVASSHIQGAAETGAPPAGSLGASCARDAMGTQHRLT